METCKTCKFWSCSLNKIDGECDMVNNIIKDPSKNFEVIVTSDDDSGMMVSLITGYNCIHHQTK